MSHTLTAHAGLRNLYAAAVADNPLVADLLVLSAMALPVLARSENLFAEQTVLFRLQGSVIYGFRLLDLAAGPLSDLFRRS